jgi:hypothetical protein
MAVDPTTPRTRPSRLKRTGLGGAPTKPDERIRIAISDTGELTETRAFEQYRATIWGALAGRRRPEAVTRAPWPSELTLRCDNWHRFLYHGSGGCPLRGGDCRERRPSQRLPEGRRAKAPPVAQHIGGAYA